MSPKKNREPQVAIVITNVRGAKLLRDCLDSVIKTAYGAFEVVVVDSQTSGISSFLKAKYPDVKVVHFDEDIGAAESHNVGVALAAASSKYVAFLDNDVVVTPDWLKSLVDLLERDESIGIAGSLSVKMSGGADLTGGFLDVSGRTRWPEIKAADKVVEVFEHRGNAFLVRKDLYNLVGGFDGHYFLFYDVADFCLRVHRAGKRVVVLPTSVVYHGVSVAARKTREPLLHRPTYYLTRNRIRFVVKNFPSNVLPKSTMLIVWQSFLSFFNALEGRRINVVLSMFRAFVYAAVHMNEILRARRVNTFRPSRQTFRVVCSLDYGGSLLAVGFPSSIRMFVRLVYRPIRKLVRWAKTTMLDPVLNWGSLVFRKISRRPVLVFVGDSIMRGYFPVVQRVLEEEGLSKMCWTRLEDTTTSVAFLEGMEELVLRHNPDVVVFNCGLHDLKRFGKPVVEVPIEQYGRNLRAIVQRLKGGTAAKLIFVTTPPVIDKRVEEVVRHLRDVKDYNEKALAVMKEEEVEVLDLFKVIMENDWYRCLGPDGVHMTELGDQVLGVATAAKISEYVKKR